VDQIVITHRPMPRLLATLAAMLVAIAVRALTLGETPVGVRIAAAGVIALAAWTAYRLLTAHVRVGEDGVEVRGVLYDAHIPWTELHGVDVVPSGRSLRAMVWGVMRPCTLRLHTPGRVLRPIATITSPDDEEVGRVIGAIRARTGTFKVPAQREPSQPVGTS
jgi:hypothetical protein